MNLKEPIDIFILFIIFIKIVFILTSIGHVILTHITRKGDSNGSDKKKEEKVDETIGFTRNF